MQQKTDYTKRFHTILQEVQTWYSWLADFTLTGMTLQGSKAVEAVDDEDVLASVCSASVLGSACPGASDVPSAIFFPIEHTQ